MDGLLKKFREAISRVESLEDKSSVDVALSSLEEIRNLLVSLRDGRPAETEHQVSEWEDVNRTLQAIRDMDDAILDAQAKIGFNDVQTVLEYGLRLAFTLKALV